MQLIEKLDNGCGSFQDPKPRWNSWQLLVAIMLVGLLFGQCRLNSEIQTIKHFVVVELER